MKALLLALLLLALSGCRTTPGRFPDLRTGAERAEAKSVALLDEHGAYRANCGGVWLSRQRIVTAFHCIKDAGQDPSDAMLRSLLESFIVTGIEMPPPWDPVGHEVKYATQESYPAEAFFTATVARVDEADDLAILQAGGDIIPAHEAAAVSARAVHDGDELDIVGSSLSFGFSYSRGYVSATREGGGRFGKFKVLQVAGMVTYGNSGGGAFDDHGDLVGIADFVPLRGDSAVDGMSFFVHRDVIRAFVERK